MIYIQQAGINNIILTLSEKSLLTDPFYLFVFQNEYEIDSPLIKWATDDISYYKNRYNQFQLIEAATGSKEGGYDTPLSLCSGQYSYTIYESSTLTLSVNDTTKRIIEEGRMVVSGIETYDAEIISGDIDPNNWILRDGYWRDLGIWVDTEAFIDEIYK